MAYNKSIIVVLAFSSLLSFYAAGRVDASIETVCKNTQNTAECVRLISPYLNVGGPADADDVLQAGLKGFNYQLEKATEQAKILKSGSKTPEMDDVLDQCLETYELLVKSTKKSLDAVVAHKCSNLENDLEHMITLTQHCNEAFTDGNQELHQINQELLALAKYNLAIGRLVASPQ